MGNLHFIQSREFRLALGFYNTGLWDACLKVVNRNRFTGPTPDSNQLNWHKLAIRLHLRRQDWRSAQEIAQIAVIQFPLNPTLIHLQGRSWEMQGKTGRKQAHACYAKVRDLAPKWLANLKRLVTTMRQMGKIKETILLLRELVSLDPGCPKALSTLIHCLNKMGLHQEANTLVRQGRFLFASCPNFAMMYNALNAPNPISPRKSQRILPFVKIFDAKIPKPNLSTSEATILKLQDHPKSRVMRAFVMSGLHRS